MTAPAFLDRNHTIAPRGYRRWLVPSAALAIHLWIGQAYALSVFNLPMSRLVGLTDTASGDWPLTTVWFFNIAIVFLGLSAAVFGTWVKRVGPRKAMFASACREFVVHGMNPERRRSRDLVCRSAQLRASLLMRQPGA